MARNWQNRIIGSGTEDPSQLVANPRNWRIHPKPQQDSLSDVLERVGWVQQVLVNKVTGNVVDGHLRVELALSRGEPSVPVLYVELDPSEEALVLATLDPLSSMAAVDEEKLRELLDEVAVTGDLEAILAEMAGGATPAEGLTDADDAPQAPDDADVYVKPGDLWLLGPHRLLCGDATNAEDVARLMDGEEADVLMADPPYGLDRNLARAAGRAWRIQNDHPDMAGQMYAACISDAPERYVWGQWNTWRYLVDALGEPDNCIVWVKSNMGMGHGYRHQHEFLAYYGTRSFPDQSDVWQSSRDYSGLHPTMKPAALVGRAIKNSSSDGASVYDPFVGSGTTIIAAETLGRRCYAMELEPKYVQVAKERWEAFTGKEATRG